MDATFLTYNNVVIRTSDLHILEGPNYLNDTIIDFHFEYLSSWYQLEDILLIPASISFWLANAPDRESFVATIEPLSLHRRNLVFFIVNDNSHWSLLVYCRKRNMFMHYDSLNSTNHESAFSAYKCMNGIISCESAGFVECCAPQQRNGYDCGLYVMEIARAICECYYFVDRFVGEDAIGGWFDVMGSVNCEYVESYMRLDLLRLIFELKQGKPNSL